MKLIDRVRKTVTQHQLFQRDETIVLGISGGPDSLALGHLLRTLRDEWHIQIHLAHLNHQLRGADSDADAEFITRLAREWELDATIESRDVAAYSQKKKLPIGVASIRGREDAKPGESPRRPISLEEAARELRYAFLTEVARKVGAHTIAVAHHADDQVETVLMHLLRGAGMAGLRGMRYKSPVASRKSPDGSQPASAQESGVQLIRPLLDVTRAEIEVYCRDNALNPRFDLSNLDTTLFRNRLRQEVLPYLEGLNPNLREILLYTSRSLADDYEFLRRQAQDGLARVARAENGAMIFHRAAWGALHPSLQRGTLRAAFERLRGDNRNLSWTHIEAARVIALEKKVGAQATLPQGLKLTVGYDKFFLAEETHQPAAFDLPQLTVERLALPRTGEVELPGSDWLAAIEPIPHAPIGKERERKLSREVQSQGDESSRSDDLRRWGVILDAQKIRGEMLLRPRRPGDRFQPAGMKGHSKSLHEFMIDEKIPHAARGRLPLLADGEKILWVCGFRADERAGWTEATRELLRITLRRKPDPTAA